MAYTYKDGAYSSTWYPSGSSVARKVKARLYYQTTDTPTTYKIDVYGQETLYKDNLGTTINGRLNLTRLAETTGSKVYTYSSSGTNHTDVYYTICPTKSRTWNKTTSTQSVTASMKAYRKDYEGTYYSTVTQTFTIPALAKYTVSFNANGHGTAPAPQSIYYGYKATQPTAPTAQGYTFLGWYTEASCTNAFNFNTTITANRTLYAKWEKNAVSVKTKVDGAWKTGDVWVKVDGQWVESSRGFVKVNDEWVEIP